MPKKKLIRDEKRKLKEVFDNFINYSKSRNLSDRTIEYYENNFKRFKKFLDDYEVNFINDIDLKTIQEYRLYLQQKLDNNSSINTYLRAIRTFLYYTMRMNYIDNFKIKLLKKEDKIKNTYTDKELEKLLKKPNLQKSSFSEYRNWVLINWFLGTGTRAKTARYIKIKDLDFAEGYVILRHVKNRKQRIIPLSKTLSDILQEYLHYRGREKEEFLFCTIYGDKISADGLSNAIRNYNRRKGLDKTSTHLFRHTFAKKWIKNGGDIFRLQKILGHSNMEMVREYVNMYGEDLKENFNKFNPLEEFNNNGEYIDMDQD